MEESGIGWSPNSEEACNRPEGENARGDGVSTHAESARYHNNEGISHAEAGDLEGAIGSFGEAIRLNPGYSEAYFNRGIAHGSRGDIKGAIEDFSEAIGLEPHLAGAYYSRGNMRVDVGDIEGALRDFDAAIGLNPGVLLPTSTGQLPTMKSGTWTWPLKTIPGRLRWILRTPDSTSAGVLPTEPVGTSAMRSGIWTRPSG